MRRKPTAKMDIDVVPYLSIMVIVLKLICLILIVLIMPIALNPHMLNVLSFKDIFKSDQRSTQVWIPHYIDCTPAGVVLPPGDVVVPLSELREPDNRVSQLLDQVEGQTNEYVVLITRPGSVSLYRQMRKLIQARNIQVGYDLLEAHVKIDWQREAKELRITLPGG